MNIAFVYPNLGSTDGQPFSPIGRLEPLAFAVLAACTPPEVEIRLYDDRFERVPFEEPVDLVGLSVETFTARRAYQIADAYRSRGIPVVMGGYHPTVLPDEAGEHADAVVIGEAEAVWPDVVEDARNRRLKRVYRKVGRTDMSGILPRRSIFRGKRYLPVSLVHFSRGCIYDCNFCALSAYYRPRLNARPWQEAAAEVAALRRRTIFFTDDNIGGKIDEAIRLFEALEPLHARWAAQISVDYLVDSSLVRLMAKAGCRGVLIGFESLSRESLAAMGKEINSVSSYRQAIANLQRHGIMHWSSFLLGYDQDGPDVFQRTVDFALSIRSCLSAFNPLTPYPGTALYDSLRNEGRMLFRGKWWLSPEFRFGDVPFLPRHMSPQQLSEGCMNARRKFTSMIGLARRATDFRANLRTPANAAFFLAANRVSRADALKKHRMALGFQA